MTPGIAIGGASAGGGLAAALALLARDRGEVEICFQQLVYPMLDDRNITPSSHYVQHPKTWNRNANIAGWSALAGRVSGLHRDGRPQVQRVANAPLTMAEASFFNRIH